MRAGAAALLLTLALLLPGCVTFGEGPGTSLALKEKPRPAELLGSARAAAAAWSSEAFLVTVAASDEGPWAYGRPERLDGRNTSWTFTFVSDRHDTELRVEIGPGGRVLFLDERPVNREALVARGFQSLSDGAIPGPEALDLPKALAPVAADERTSRFLEEPLGSLEYKLIGKRGWFVGLTGKATEGRPGTLVAFVTTGDWQVESLDTFPGF